MKNVDEFFSGARKAVSLSIQKVEQPLDAMQRELIYRTFAEDQRALEASVEFSPLVRWAARNLKVSSPQVVKSRIAR